MGFPVFELSVKMDRQAPPPPPQSTRKGGYHGGGGGGAGLAHIFTLTENTPPADRLHDPASPNLFLYKLRFSHLNSKQGRFPTWPSSQIAYGT